MYIYISYDFSFFLFFFLFFFFFFFFFFFSSRRRNTRWNCDWSSDVCSSDLWVYMMGRRAGRLSSYTLLLAGVVTASFLSAMIIFVLTLLSTRDVRGTAFWLMGDLSVVTDAQIHSIAPAIILGIVALYAFSKDLNVLLLGEGEAAHRGVNVLLVETVVYLLASLLTGLAVSVSGAIGYLGLLVPHLGRMLVGNDHRTLIPAAAFGGAIILVLSDTLARTLFAPAELPVGAVTAIAGAPVFIYLLRRTTG